MYVVLRPVSLASCQFRSTPSSASANTFALFAVCTNEGVIGGVAVVKCELVAAGRVAVEIIVGEVHGFFEHVRV